VLERLKNYLLEKWPLNRVVAVAVAAITPFAAALGGTVFTWLSEKLPYIGEHVNAAQVVPVFVAGAIFTTTAIVTVTYQWLKGWHIHEDRIFAAAAGAYGPTDEPSDDIRRALKDKPGD
jgi:hypothetical protein